MVLPFFASLGIAHPLGQFSLLQGVVIESQVERGLGTVATTLVQRGTLKVGDPFIAGAAAGKVRMLITDKGDRIKEAGPSMPVQVRTSSDSHSRSSIVFIEPDIHSNRVCVCHFVIKVIGMDGVPSAGDLLIVGEDEATLRNLAEARQKIAREKSSAAFGADLQASILDMMAGTAETREVGSGPCISGPVTSGAAPCLIMILWPRLQIREVTVVIKADVQGSAEALASSLRALVKEDEVAIVKVSDPRTAERVCGLTNCPSIFVFIITGEGARRRCGRHHKI